MVNLLTSQQKNIIAREYKRRRSVVWFCALAFIAASSLVLLLPSLLYVVNDHREVSRRLAAEKGRATQAAEGEDPVVIVKEVNRKLAILKRVRIELPLPDSVITALLENIPAGVKVTSISYERKKDDGLVLVGGVAPDREALLAFLKVLRQEPLFSEVDLPISSFVKNRDIDFSMKITITPPEREKKGEDKNNEGQK